MATAPTISVVIPAYNAQEYVANAITSAIGQTYPPQEIIVVDDGSRDNTAEVVSRLSPLVRLLRQANAGPGSARNRGVRASTGSWVAFLDADDAWLPTKLEKQCPFTADDSVAIVHCRDARHWSHSKQLDFETLWERNAIVTSSALVRREAFEQVGGFSESRDLDCVEDYNLWLRIVAAGWRVATCPEALFLYTPAQGNLSSQIEKFAKAELCNIETLQDSLQLNGSICNRKRTATLVRYGRELVYLRQMRAARRMFIEAFRSMPSFSIAYWWAVTLVPPAILDFRRRLNPLGT